MFGASASVAGPKVAVLPLVAEPLLPSARDSLESDLRDAVVACGAQLQPADVTRAHINEGAAAGLDCRLTADECALRVGLIADVDAVLVTSVELVGERMLMRGAFLDVDGQPRRHVAGEIRMPSADGGVSLRAMTQRLVLGKGKPTPLPFALGLDPADARIIVDGAPQADGPVVWLSPGKHKLRVEAEGRVPLERDIDVAADGDGNTLTAALPFADPVAAEPSGWLYVGAVAAGAGALLATISFGFAGAIELTLQDGAVPREARADTVGLGQFLVVTGAVGAGLVGGGAALALWSPE